MTAYPYKWIMSFPNECDEGLISKDLYAFKSTKSKQTYWIWVEGYKDNVYVIKFHLKAHRNSPERYSILTGLNEPRAIVATCFNLIINEFRNNPDASFAFVGACSEGESEIENRRFVFYSKMIATYIPSTEYQHYRILRKSAYLIVPRRVIQRNPNFPNQISESFKNLYSYFE